MHSKPNVCLIVMDTARAQSALPTENPGVMPNLSSFASEGTTFTNAITTAPWTLPSHASMFTGQYTSDHQTNAGSLSFNPDIAPLATRLSEEGYETAAFSNNTWISPEFGFSAGFDQFYRGWELFSGGVDLPDIVRKHDNRVAQIRAILSNLTATDLPVTVINALYSRFYHKQYDYGAKLTNFRIKRYLSNKHDTSQPFFLFANYLEPHLKYNPPKSYRYEHQPTDVSTAEMDSVNQEPWEYICGNISMNDDDFRTLEALYEGELTYLDYRLGKLFDWMDEEGILDNTLVIVAGDHGENIGDHGLMDHQYCLYDTLLRVPLILRYPDLVPKDATSKELVELRDVYPTVLEACGLNIPDKETVSNYSLTGGVSNRLKSLKRREHAFAEYLVPQPDIAQLKDKTRETKGIENIESFNRSLRCVRTERWKLIRSSRGEIELYDLNEDPVEGENLKSEHPDIVSELSEILEAEFDTIEYQNNEQFDDMRSSTRSRLEDLGYI